MSHEKKAKPTKSGIAHHSRLTTHDCEQLVQQVAQLTDALQRERADADNIRRRHDEQISSLKTVVKASVVHDLMPVIDNFERALRHSPVASSKQQVANTDTKLDEWVKGVMSIKVQFEKTLEQMGVERIKTVGEVFDPRLHEAVSMEDGDPEINPEQVALVEVISDELQPGYVLGNEVIRHAMVRVRMQPSQEQAASSKEHGEQAK